MRIVYLITGLGMGGAEVVTVNLANEMVELGHDVIFLSLTGDNLLIDKMNKAINVYSLKMDKGFMPFVKALLKTRKIFHSYKPDVVHAQMFHANMLARIVRLICPLKLLICSEHSKDIGGKFRMLLYRMTDWLSDINTNVSIESTEYFIDQKAFSSRKSMAMYNGIYLDRFKRNEEKGSNVRRKYSIQNDDFLFLNVGRLVEAKDQCNLLKAFALLTQKRESVKLMIVGEGELRSELESIIVQYGLENSVILAGAHSNVEDYYSASNCFVLSSAWEGLPTCIIEAKANSLPIVSTAAGQEIVDAQFVVPIRDSQKLYMKMDKMLQLSSQELTGIGHANFLDANQFDIYTVARKWNKIYSHKSYII